MKLTIELDDGWFDYNVEHDGCNLMGINRTLEGAMEAALDAYDKVKEQQAARKPRRTY